MGMNARVREEFEDWPFVKFDPSKFSHYNSNYYACSGADPEGVRWARTNPPFADPFDLLALC